LKDGKLTAEKELKKLFHLSQNTSIRQLQQLLTVHHKRLNKSKREE